MGITRFPHGVSSFGMPVLGGSYIPPTKGEYYWVDSNATMNGTGDFDNPFTSVVSAIAASTANNDDVIIMKQGHAESIKAAGTWTPKAGSTIVGLGYAKRKPLITFSTVVGSTILVTAQNVTFINFDTTSGVAEHDICFHVQAAGCSILGVNYRETDTSYMTETWITTTVAGDALTVEGCRLVQVTAPTANGAAILLVGADDAVIRNNVIYWTTTNNAASGGIHGLTTESLRLCIMDNFIDCQAGSSVIAINPLASSTGIIARNGATTPNGAGSIVGRSGMLTMENYAGTSGTTSAILDPASGV